MYISIAYAVNFPIGMMTIPQRLPHRVWREGKALHSHRRWVLLLIAVGVVFAGTVLLRIWQSPVGATPECPEGRPIVLDPGHGGVDGGTNVPGMLEKDLVLDIAQRTAQQLEARRVPVVLTRSADVDLGGPHDSGRLSRDLTQRIRIANQCRAALMLSLHINSAADARERGVILFYQPSGPSRDAAYFIDDALRRGLEHGRRELPHPQGTFAVLRRTKAPAVLVELGFITNESDRARLRDPAYRTEIAQILANACAVLYQIWVQQ